MSQFRNLAIIAHVDHGKTTLVDQLLQAGGAYRENQAVTERAMDSMDLEREKGITIKSKNTAVHWNEHIINIVDTPGHADFGGEVERVMKMVDGVILVVDAFGGPQAQTRFVLRKALQEGLKPIIVVNKIDRPNSDPLAVHDKVLELFLELDATEDQFDAPTLYGSAKNGFFSTSHDVTEGDCVPLIEAIIEHIPAPVVDSDAPFKMLVSNIDWDDYVGRIAIGKILAGSIKKGDTVFRFLKDGTKVRTKIGKVFEYTNLGIQDTEDGVAGNIVGIAGFEDADIGETLAGDEDAEPLPPVNIDPPSVQMQFSINDGPFVGKDGKHVQSRVIHDRLFREMKTNVSIHVEDSDTAGVFNVSARGAMQIAVLVETMRREGFELLVSRPTVILKRDENDKRLEPWETLYLEMPSEYANSLLKILNERKGVLENMETNDTSGRTLITANIPTRGIIGLEFELVNITSGHGIMSHLFDEYKPWAGHISARQAGTLVSMDTGPATAYSLLALEGRGTLFVNPTEEVYSGMVIGENSRADDLPVNPVKAKKLDNIRSANKENTQKLAPALKFSLERAIEYIAPDELVEVTPNFLRLRKRILDPHERKRAVKAAKAEG
ncbi:MAG: translational GTPase TypA [Akkermansiaceae bacterium]|nr:translational GTPase TypA [Akkermansiaceae bacterium]MDB2428842.1 translational GTPase TypA [Akkermansiaceae bacterium]MDG1071392.1 translational GTPase TypA [Akkermansiaceae bacterium]